MATRQWADLPAELISLIADRLGIVDLCRFRSVCRGWNSASSTSSAQIESSPNHDPWFLLYGENSECSLLAASHPTETDKNKYNIDIPAMNGATCIASMDGWLLLYKEGSVFFFCPFSGSKIDLPRFPKSKERNLVAAFSSPPTSQHCIVAVACYGRFEVEVHVICRGAKEWTKHVYNNVRGYINTIKAVAYAADKTFHFYDDVNRLLTFSPVNREWKIYRITYGNPTRDKHVENLPYELSRDNFKNNSMNKRLGLAEDVSVITCGTVVPYDQRDKIVFNESISQKSESRQLKGVWIKPRFFKIPPDVSW